MWGISPNFAIVHASSYFSDYFPRFRIFTVLINSITVNFKELFQMVRSYQFLAISAARMEVLIERRYRIKPIRSFEIPHQCSSLTPLGAKIRILYSSGLVGRRPDL